MNFYELLFNRGQPSGEGMTHFERLFAAKLVGGGEIKELEGVPPLLFNADGSPLISWRISGNTVQNGVPTPQNPIMPQGTGERTGNLASTEQGGVNSSDGSDQAYESRLAQIRSQYIPCSAETIYMVACTEYPVQNYVSFYDANKAYLSRTNGASITQARQFTTPVDSAYMRITMFHAIDGQIYPYIVGAKIMLNSGSTALPHEPYGYKIPISSANTTTPVYLGEVETTRKIKKLVLTGEETGWQAAAASGGRNRFTLTITNAINADTANPFSMCTHLPLGVEGATWNTDDIYTIASSKIYMRLTAQYNELADFKSYLQQQYAAGTPVTVWYVLANPTTGIVNEPLMKIGNYADSLTATQAGVEVPTIKGNNTLDIDATIKPSNVYIKYKT